MPNLVMIAGYFMLIGAMLYRMEWKIAAVIFFVLAFGFSILFPIGSGIFIKIKGLDWSPAFIAILVVMGCIALVNGYIIAAAGAFLLSGFIGFGPPIIIAPR